MTFRRHDNFIYVQITFARCSRANQASFIRIKYVASRSVGFGKNCYGTNAHFTARAHHAHSNFTTVSDQYFVYHALCFNYDFYDTGSFSHHPIS